MEIIKYGDYNEFKAELDNELQKATEGFVRIGYLLKVAKDTDILKDSGYANVNDFAEAEYGLDKTQVSRFIRINDRFSEGGYSDRLMEQYRGFGHAKLTIMLQLPDEINEEITVDYSKSEIQMIKEEVDAEKAVTDIEIILEEKDYNAEELENKLSKVLYQYCKEHPEKYIKLHEAVMETVYDGTNNPVVEKLMQILAPSDMAAIVVRIPGTGRYMMSIKGKEQGIAVISMRNAGEKEKYDWDEMIRCIEGLCPDNEPQKAWEIIYREAFPKKAEQKSGVAPVQPKKTGQKKQAKVTKAEPPKKEDKTIIPVTEQIETVTREVVEETQDLEEIKEKLAIEFIKRYETRLEDSDNMRDEVHAILDKVHKYQWIFEHKGVEYFVVEAAGYIKLRRGGEIITTFNWADFYELMHKVYWKEAENYIPPRLTEENTDESCTSATEEQIQGQAAIEDYPEYLPENVKSNMEVWQGLKTQVKARVESISKAIEEDNYALVKWDAKKLVELMEAIR